MKSATRYGVTVLLSGLLLSCMDSGGDGQPIQPLSLPTQIDFVSSPPQAASAHITPQAFDLPGTDYATDEVYVGQYSRQSTPVRLNALLCVLNKVDYGAMLNKGVQTLRVQADDCPLWSSGPWIPGPFTELTLSSSRADNDSPHIISLKLQKLLVGKSLALSFQVRIDKGISLEDPYGEFSIDGRVEDAFWLDMAAPQAGAVVSRWGVRVSARDDGLPLLQEIEAYGGAPFENAAQAPVFLSSATTVDDPGHETGKMFLHKRYGSSPDAVEYYSAESFDSSYLVQVNGSQAHSGSGQCFLRNRQEWVYANYNFYAAEDMSFRGKMLTAGQRIDLVRKFSFDWQGQQGKLILDSVIMNDNTELPDGAVVVRTDLPSHPEYRLQWAGGGFRRQAISREMLSSYQGRIFRAGTLHAGLGVLKAWWLQVDQNNRFQVLGWEDNTEQGVVLRKTLDHDQDPATPELPVSGELVLENGQMLTLAMVKSPRLRYHYVHDDAVASAQRELWAIDDRDVYATTMDLFPEGVTAMKLYCGGYCMKGGMTQADLDGFTGYEEIFYGAQSLGQPLEYEMELVDGRLRLVDLSVGKEVSFVGLDMSVVGLDKGVWPGMILKVQPKSADISNQQYLARTSSFTWNSRPGAHFYRVDDGSPVLLDEPLELAYIHDALNDMNERDPHLNPLHGVPAKLYYRESRSLAGMPGYEDLLDGVTYRAIAAAGTRPVDSRLVMKPVLLISDNVSAPRAFCAGLSTDGLADDPELPRLSDQDFRDPDFAW